MVVGNGGGVINGTAPVPGPVWQCCLQQFHEVIVIQNAHQVWLGHGRIFRSKQYAMAWLLPIQWASAVAQVTVRVDSWPSAREINCAIVTGTPSAVVYIANR